MNLDRYAREAQLYREVDGKTKSCVPKLYDFVALPSMGEGKKESTMYLERCRAGSFLQYYHDSLKPHLEQKNLNTPQQQLPVLQPFFASLIAILKDFHALNLVHGDFKPANVLVKIEDGRPRLLLADLDSAQPEGQMKASRFVASASYCSPEMLNYRQSEGASSSAIGKPIDIWALGCCFYGLYTEQPLRWSALVMHGFTLKTMLKKLSAMSVSAAAAVQGTPTDHVKQQASQLIADMQSLEAKVRELSVAHLAYLKGISESAADSEDLAARDAAFKDISSALSANLKQAENVVAELGQAGAPLGAVHQSLDSFFATIKAKINETWDALNSAPEPDPDNDPMVHLIWQMLRPMVDKRSSIETVAEFFHEHFGKQEMDVSAKPNTQQEEMK